MKVTSTGLQPASTTLELVERGRFREAAKLLAENPPTTKIDVIAAAEVELYFGRLAEVEQLLARAADLEGDISLATRFALAEGEYQFLRRDPAAAKKRFNSAYCFAEFLRDNLAIATSLCRSARILSLEGSQVEAIGMLHEAYESLRGFGMRGDFLRGVIDLQLAICERKLGHDEAAEQLYVSAIETLKDSERGRYFALALCSYGVVERERGNLPQSIELFEQAMNLLNTQELYDDLAHCLSELSGTLIRAKSYDRAERLLGECLALHQQTGRKAGEARALTLMAQLELDRNRPRRARESADRALELADAALNSDIAISARINLARTLTGDKERERGAELLKEAIQLADEHKLVELKIEATIYLAEVYHALDPIKGPAQIQLAGDLLKARQIAWLVAELSRVDQKYQTGRIWLDGNKLIFDSNLLPNWYDAKRALETFLLKNALAQTDQNLTEAGKLLGISKVHVHDKRKQYQV